MKLAHISDIHFRGIARHKEYTECFKRLLVELRDEVKPDYIICTGDWFHTKTVAITPEIIEKLTWVFRELSAIAPLIGILGNHDGNLANEDRQDTITPIADAINSPRVQILTRLTGMERWQSFSRASKTTKSQSVSITAQSQAARQTATGS